MPIQSRPYTRTDFERVSEFLQMTYLLNHNLHNWSIRHWEGNNYHRSDLNEAPIQNIQIWEEEGCIVGLVHPEYEGNAVIEIHPDYRHLEAEILAWAEQYLIKSENGKKKLELWVFDSDQFRESLLQDAGYQKTLYHMNNRKRTMAIPVTDHPIAEGYTIRGMQRTTEDAQGMADLLNAAFGRSFHQADEYANFQTAPHYRPEFDLVAVAADGKIVANAQLTLVPHCHYAEFEPVCTHPEHQRKGLARSLMAHGLKMLQDTEITSVYVDAAGDNPASNALYAALGFTEVMPIYLWVKEW